MASSLASVTAEDILESLYRVVEPRRGVTIVDLGLVYGVAVAGQPVTVEIAMPEPDAAAMANMTRQVETVLRRRHPGLDSVAVDWVREPPWREDFVTAEGLLQLANPLLPATGEDATPAGVMTTLTGVIDPEPGVNIVDLGLVYEVAIDRGQAAVTMTLTTAGCPLHGSIEAAVIRAVETRHLDLGGGTVNLVRDPPWDPDRISPAGRAHLGWGRQR